MIIRYYNLTIISSYCKMRYTISNKLRHKIGPKLHNIGTVLRLKRKSRCAIINMLKTISRADCDNRSSISDGASALQNALTWNTA